MNGNASSTGDPLNLSSEPLNNSGSNLFQEKIKKGSTRKFCTLYWGGGGVVDLSSPNRAAGDDISVGT